MEKTDLDKVLERLMKLEDRISQLEKRLYPAYPTAYPTTPILPDATVSKCSKCGLELKGTMGYVCYQFDCPTFPKPFC